MLVTVTTPACQGLGAGGQVRGDNWVGGAVEAFSPWCYTGLMHHSSQLHLSKRKNILQNHGKSNLISLIWFLIPLVVLGLLINFTQLNLVQLFGGFIVSLLRISAAYTAALIFSLVIALLITANVKVENLALPVFDVLQSFPSFALFPVLVAAIHSSEVIIISVLTITIIWPILFTLIGGIKGRRADLEEAATIFGARGVKRLFYFTLPELKPALITGSIIGWGEGWEFIIGAELLVSGKWGIGHYLGQLGSQQQNLLLAFGIVVLMLLLFALNKIIWLPFLNRATKYQFEE